MRSLTIPNPAWKQKAGEFNERIERRLLDLMERNNVL
jgi:hypothetical protein